MARSTSCRPNSPEREPEPKRQTNHNTRANRQCVESSTHRYTDLSGLQVPCPKKQSPECFAKRHSGRANLLLRQSVAYLGITSFKLMRKPRLFQRSITAHECHPFGKQ